MNISKLLACAATSLAAIAMPAAFAQAPAGSTGQCKDGTYTSAKSERGACSRHGGVKTWFAESKAAQEPANPPVPSAAAEAPAKPAAKAPSKASTKAASKESSRAASKQGTTSSQPASGGGPGMVWVNTPTKVYHCNGDRWYGKTKKGEYMSEADAKAQGYRPSRNKSCG